MSNTNFLAVRRLARRVLPPRAYGAVRSNLVSVRGGVQSTKALAVRLRRALVPKYQYPSLLAITLTTRCNLRCFICRRDGFKGEDLTFENLYSLEKAIRYARTIDLTGWGEPFLYPRFGEALDYIYSLNPRKDLIQITTNGTRLSADVASLLSGHLKFLLISLNAATADTYNRDMRYGDFHKTLSAVRSFLSGLQENDRSKIQLHFVAHTENFHEIPDFVALANHLGISAVSIGQYLVGTSDHTQYGLLNVRPEYNALVAEAEDLGDTLGVRVHARRFFTERERSPQQCMSPFDECFIGVNGDVAPCCFCGSYRIGNVYETGFEGVWFGDAYQRLRRKRYLPACQKCAPFIPLDDYEAHFTAYFKETTEFEEIEQTLKAIETPEAESEKQASVR